MERGESSQRPVRLGGPLHVERHNTSFTASRKRHLEDDAQYLSKGAQLNHHAYCSIEEWLAKSDVERDPRQALSPLERLAEDGEVLRQKLIANSKMFATLQAPRSTRARCRASDNCIYLQALAPDGNVITSEYRICVHGAENEAWFGSKKHYYHVVCFSTMINLTDLLPSKFQMDNTCGRWGIMVEKWFEHQGRINPYKIASYIKKRQEYAEEYRSWVKDWRMLSKKQRRNRNVNKSQRANREPRPPVEPSPEDYTTNEEDVCALVDILKHSLVQITADAWWMRPDVPEIRAEGQAG
ncbi:hypothetical protein QQS21_007100 [Conoideocrella luteorostrata]|uniref:Uncharacterized protein n=1 Tax=Conoideocrella luteorostrata TaxID=1105319 RepID=A0AAJ0CLT3_9HYPO|nr:hypothetical protein QQS21_007100 [Conoideocrella luteorostrata]